MSEETTEGTITRVDYAPGGTTVTLRADSAEYRDAAPLLAKLAALLPPEGT